MLIEKCCADILACMLHTSLAGSPRGSPVGRREEGPGQGGLLEGGGLAVENRRHKEARGARGGGIGRVAEQAARGGGEGEGR